MLLLLATLEMSRVPPLEVPVELPPPEVFTAVWDGADASVLSSTPPRLPDEGEEDTDLVPVVLDGDVVAVPPLIALDTVDTLLLIDVDVDDRFLKMLVTLLPTLGVDFLAGATVFGAEGTVLGAVVGAGAGATTGFATGAGAGLVTGAGAGLVGAGVASW